MRYFNFGKPQQSPTMFEIGEKVVCVDDAFPAGVADFHSALPYEGVTYTIRDITPGETWDKKETCAVHLAEIQGKINQRGIEHGFSSHRFRPLEEDTLEQAVEEVKEAKIFLRRINSTENE